MFCYLFLLDNMFFFLDKNLPHLGCTNSKEGLCSTRGAVDPHETDYVSAWCTATCWELKTLPPLWEHRAWKKVKNAVFSRSEGDVSLLQQAPKICAGLEPAGPLCIAILPASGSTPAPCVGSSSHPDPLQVTVPGKPEPPKDPVTKTKFQCLVTEGRCTFHPSLASTANFSATQALDLVSPLAGKICFK